MVLAIATEKSDCSLIYRRNQKIVRKRVAFRIRGATLTEATVRHRVAVIDRSKESRKYSRAAGNAGLVKTAFFFLVCVVFFIVFAFSPSLIVNVVANFNSTQSKFGHVSADFRHRARPKLEWPC